ncbi:unnamed protein product [Paramecium pentaurelia]|uniref:RING-type domain-containing protein n=1 Tax=Paramecium pentaurelia TaxID=43138 RepID=A0A8S1Y8C8_9CILI|nr:unnamed protein product [Paramecium pentaurelia]
MGNSSRHQNQQGIQSSQQTKQINKSESELIKYLAQSCSTFPSQITKNPEFKAQKVNCLRCDHILFDDGLGRTNKCEECQIPYVIKDGVITLLNHSQDIQCCPYGFPLQHLDSIVLRVNQNCINHISYGQLMSQIILPFFEKRERIITSGACFNIDQFEFRVVGCGSQLQGIVGTGTKIYCYESYTDRILYKLKIYTQRKNFQDELFHYFFSHPKENQLIQDSYIKINNQEYFVLQCTEQSGRLHLYTKMECISNVPRLSQVQFIILKQPIEFSHNNRNYAMQQVLNYVIHPYFAGLTRYLEKGQILRIGDFIFEVCLQEDYGFVIPNQTHIQITDQIDQRMNLQQFQSTQNYNIISRSINNQNNDRQDQIESLHRLLNTFIQLNENGTIEGNLGCEEHEIQQLPVRKINLEQIKQLDEDHMKCLICLCEYEEEDQVKTIPCLHYFHDDCIDRWLKKSRHCPICKNELEI